MKGIPMKITVVVQARTGSSRLPGKVLLPVAGEPLLLRQLQRLQAVETPHELCVATTPHESDEPIRELARRAGIRWVNGSETDLLDRHYLAGLATNADVVVKVPSDCPLIDPGVVDRVLAAYRSEAASYDFATNLCPPSYPDGNDVEVIPMKVLAAAWREARTPVEREHTTPFIWDRPERFRILNVRWESGLDYSKSHRFTVDYEEDYRFVAAIYERLWSHERPLFTLGDILALLEREPALLEQNARFAGSTWQKKAVGELKTLRLDGEQLVYGASDEA
jgi:spore coat polysaccharide biosynthesis protein SpsF